MKSRPEVEKLNDSLLINDRELISISQLVSIVNDYDNIDKLMAAFKENPGIAKKLIEQTGYIDRVRSFNTHDVSRSIISAIELSSLSVDIFWLIISFANIEAFSVLLISLVGVMTVLIGAGLFWYSYRKKKEEMRKKQEELIIYKLQIQALDELIMREGKVTTNTLKPDKKIKPSEIKVSKTASALRGIGVSLVLTGTFFWAITDILTTLNLISAASIVTGPFGLLVASIIALSIGLCLGVFHYDACKNLQIIKSEKTELYAEHAQKYGHYRGIKAQPQPVKSQKQKRVYPIIRSKTVNKTVKTAEGEPSLSSQGEPDSPSFSTDNSTLLSQHSFLKSTPPSPTAKSVVRTHSAPSVTAPRRGSAHF